MTDSNETFLREGLFRFAEAKATVEAYQLAATECVVRVLREQIAPLKVLGADTTSVAPHFTRGSPEGWAAYADFEGSFQGQPASWQVGIWWQDPVNGTTVAAFADCMRGPKRLKSYLMAVPEPSGGDWDCWKCGLQVQIKKGVEVDEALAQVLKEVARQVVALPTSSVSED